MVQSESILAPFFLGGGVFLLILEAVHHSIREGLKK